MDIFLKVKRNNLVELKKYLEYRSVNIQDENKKNLLHHAVEGKAIDCINVLIENDIDINHRDLIGQSPVFDAAIKGNLGILKILIRNRCDINLQDNYGNIALFYAIKTNNKAVVDVIASVTDLNVVNYKKESVLFKAIKYNYKDIKKFMNDSNCTNFINDTILHYAVKYNNLELVKHYSNRYNINIKNDNNESVFFYAVRYSNRDIIRYLLSYTPVLDITNKYSEKLLDFVDDNHYLIDDLISNYITSLDYIFYKQNNAHIYKYLCYRKINFPISKILLNKKDNYSLSLLDYIKFYDDKETMKMLEKQNK